MVKLKELTVLDIVGLQAKLARTLQKDTLEGEDLFIDDYAIALVKIMGKSSMFDYSDIKEVNSFDEAVKDVSCVEDMLRHAYLTLEKIGEVYKKKTSLETRITSTQETSKKKSSKGS